jgi:hypothetical protein
MARSNNRITVTGHSDDIIVIRDPQNGDDEHGAYNGARHLRFSDGTVLRVEYSPKDYFGKWKMERVETGSAEYKHEAAKDDEDDYSDVVTLVAPGLRVTGCSKGLKPTKQELVDAIEQYDLSTLSVDQLSTILAMFKE